MAEHKHVKKCPGCYGQGTIQQQTIDRKTGKVKTHRIPCPRCGGSGRA